MTHITSSPIRAPYSEYHPSPTALCTDSRIVLCSQQVAHAIFSRYQQMNDAETYQHHMHIAFAWWRSWIAVNKQSAANLPYIQYMPHLTPHPTSTKLAQTFIATCAPVYDHPNQNSLLLPARHPPSLFLHDMLDTKTPSERDCILQEMCLYICRDMRDSKRATLLAWALHQLYIHYPDSVSAFFKQCNIQICDPSKLYCSDQLNVKFWALFLQKHAPFQREEQRILRTLFDENIGTTRFRHNSLFTHKLLNNQYWSEKPFEVFAKIFYTTTYNDTPDYPAPLRSAREGGACLDTLLRTYPTIRSSPLYSLLLGNNTAWMSLHFIQPELFIPQQIQNNTCLTEEKLYKLISEYHNTHVISSYTIRVILQLPPYQQYNICQQSGALYTRICPCKNHPQYTYPAESDPRVLETTLYIMITAPIKNTQYSVLVNKAQQYNYIRQQKLIRLNAIKRLCSSYPMVTQSWFYHFLYKTTTIQSKAEFAQCVVEYCNTIMNNYMQPDKASFNDEEVPSTLADSEIASRHWSNILMYYHNEHTTPHPIQSLLSAFRPYACTHPILHAKAQALYAEITQCTHVLQNIVEENHFIVEETLYLLLTQPPSTITSASLTIRMEEIQFLIKKHPATKQSWLFSLMKDLTNGYLQVVKKNIRAHIEAMHLDYTRHVARHTSNDIPNIILGYNDDFERTLLNEPLSEEEDIDAWNTLLLPAKRSFSELENP